MAGKVLSVQSSCTLRSRQVRNIDYESVVGGFSHGKPANLMGLVGPCRVKGEVVAHPDANRTCWHAATRNQQGSGRSAAEQAVHLPSDSCGECVQHRAPLEAMDVCPFACGVRSGPE
jgi:hypothetical protein